MLPGGWSSLQSNGTATVYLNSLANTTFTITYYAVHVSNGAWDATYLFSKTITTGAKGDYSSREFFSPLSNGEFICATATDPSNSTSELSQPREPALFVPGIVGSMPLSNMWASWFLQRGFAPQNLVLEPLKNTYADLIQTMVNAGYALNDPGSPMQGNLFEAVYDWRMPPGPIDGTADGYIDVLNSGGTLVPLTAAKLFADFSAGTYYYGVDYLGYWMLQATLAWNQQYPGLTMPGIDILAHSTGGLVARTYLQSDAYSGAFTYNGQALHMPKVDHFIMMGVPNDGAPGPWLTLNDQWSDDDTASVIDNWFANQDVLAPLFNDAYQLVLKGKKIFGPDSIIDTDSIKDPGTGLPSPELFIEQYCPTLETLLAAYPFFVNVGKAGPPEVPTDYENSFVLDLNAGDKSDFTDPDVVQHVIDIYGDGQVTPSFAYEINHHAPWVLYSMTGKVMNLPTRNRHNYWMLRIPEMARCRRDPALDHSSTIPTCSNLVFNRLPTPICSAMLRSKIRHWTV